ncbi:hypothetical protein C8J56DRAFT_817604 [Mycena floridula]|nr:hypothetical protein C8J56DRAFT_817604 [Mycena floridula]
MSISKRLHISGLTPSLSETDLRTRLSSFGTVESVDGFGLLDGIGQPRKFAYATINGNPKDIAKCVNVLSGSTWKGAKLRLGDATPDFTQRAEKEKDEEPPKKKQKRRGARYAEDMSLVTPENYQQHPGWKMTSVGKLLRPMRMRPGKPLPPPLQLATKPDVEGTKKRKKREKSHDTRARRKTIDVTRWGGERLSGAFLANGLEASVSEAVAVQDEHHASESSDSSEDVETPAPPAIVQEPAPAVIQEPVDAVQEQVQSLSLIQSLFAGNDTWMSTESVGSDVDVNEVPAELPYDDVQFEIVPMAVDDTSSKLKHLFAPHEDQGGFSLVNHLDLDLDDEIVVEDAKPPVSQEEPAPAPIRTRTSIMLDPKKLRFFHNGLLNHSNFRRVDSEEQIKKRWEDSKVELTKGWKKRWREAGKVRRRRGGGEDE